jgi:hypothetical protein
MDTGSTLLPRGAVARSPEPLCPISPAFRALAGQADYQAADRLPLGAISLMLDNHQRPQGDVVFLPVQRENGAIIFLSEGDRAAGWGAARGCVRGVEPDNHERLI